VALAWLLQHSPNILIIAGTSSVEHLHDNLEAASLVLPADIVAQLDRIAALPRRKNLRGLGGDQ
jgi:pyridoxine 4-dehydrogenase